MVNRRTNPLSELARYGFEELSEALANLDRLIQLVGDRARPAVIPLSLSASPDRALRFLIRFAEENQKLAAKLLGNEGSAKRVCALTGASDAMADLLIRRPELAEMFFKPAKLPDSLAVSRVDRLEMRKRYRELLIQIADWDLSTRYQDSYREVSQALSDLATETLDAGVSIATGELVAEGRITQQQAQDAGLAVIAMGKCGARELNYLSDVDVIYACSNHEEAVPVATKIASRLALVIDESGIEPGLWQVDPNLRPEGKDGALVRTVDSHISYYQKWAHPWEFQALLKARFVAGDQGVGTDYIARIKPLIWQRQNRAEIVESARNLRKRVLDFIPTAEQEREIKLGRGGLRDVEFTAQLLQLVHGVVDESLRVMNTLDALKALADAGLIAREDRVSFTKHYITLRSIEHRVQLLKMRRTHLMPTDDHERRRIARSLDPAMDSQALEMLWLRTRGEVATLHDTVFYRPLLAATASLSPGEVALSPEEVSSRLTALGFQDPKGAMGHIKALTSGLSRRATIQRTLLPVLIRYMAEGTAPDRALLTFRRLSERLGESHWFLKMLRDSSGAAERLMITLSLSAFASRLLEHIPESSAWFSSKDELNPIPKEDLLREMLAVVERGQSDETVAESLRQIRRREVLRCAIAAVLGEAQLGQISQTLSSITESYIASMLQHAQLSEGTNIDVAVIAMGRLGGEELGFGSDADVMLLYGGDSSDTQQPAERLTASLLSKVRDPLLNFELDLDLRPEGKNGPRIKSLDAYTGYYEKWADTWEFQALIRARPISGSEELRLKFLALINRYRYPEELSAKQLLEIRRIKARVESERLPQGADPNRHLKLGRGSISDVEWLVQLYQLRHANQHPELRTLSTLEALAALVSLKLTSQEQAAKLSAAWLLASRIRSAIVLGQDKTVDSLPVDRSQLEVVARILEFAPGSASALEEQYLATTRKSRQVFEELFLK
jgi:[glutamine synthetase] adenylyltransferase / [glutamine synthetase]-adenylyl-L-tyrosine phosphorylase